jgi:hypothetical protein
VLADVKRSYTADLSAICYASDPSAYHSLSGRNVYHHYIRTSLRSRRHSLPLTTMEAPTKGTFRLAEREFPAVTWYKDPALRKTYICLMFVVITSATNGYDGSMVNGLQSLEIWQNYFGHPTGSLLGLFACIMSIGSLVALPIVPYTADILGRRWGVSQTSSMIPTCPRHTDTRNRSSSAASS